MSNDAGKSYKFDMQNGVITGVSEIENGYLKAERLDTNETWTVQGNQVVKTQNDHGMIETTTYSDADGDGLYAKISELKTPAGTGAAISSESHQESDKLAETQHNSANESTNDSDHTGTPAVQPAATSTATALHDESKTGTSGSGTASGDQPDTVTEGQDGYEYHATTASDHELHGSDLHDNVLAGAQGDDKLVGGTRNDVLDGADGNNTLDGGSGNDVLVAGGETNHGQNHLNGGSGDDILVAGGTKTHSLDDLLKANPVLSSTISNDTKYASLATLVQGATDDSGGGAANTFELQSGNGHDLIFNFHASSDKLEIHRGLNGSDIQDSSSLASHIHVSGNDVSIDLGNGNSVTLVGVDVGHLSAANLAWI